MDWSNKGRIWGWWWGCVSFCSGGSLKVIGKWRSNWKWPAFWSSWAIVWGGSWHGLDRITSLQWTDRSRAGVFCIPWWFHFHQVLLGLGMVTHLKPMCGHFFQGVTLCCSGVKKTGCTSTWCRKTHRLRSKEWRLFRAPAGRRCRAFGEVQAGHHVRWSPPAESLSSRGRCSDQNRWRRSGSSKVYEQIKWFSPVNPRLKTPQQPLGVHIVPHLLKKKNTTVGDDSPFGFPNQVALSRFPPSH